MTFPSEQPITVEDFRQTLQMRIATAIHERGWLLGSGAGHCYQYEHLNQYSFMGNRIGVLLPLPEQSFAQRFASFLKRKKPRRVFVGTIRIDPNDHASAQFNIEGIANVGPAAELAAYLSEKFDMRFTVTLSSDLIRYELRGRK